MAAAATGKILQFLVRRVAKLSAAMPIEHFAQSTIPILFWGFLITFIVMGPETLF